MDNVIPRNRIGNSALELLAGSRQKLRDRQKRLGLRLFDLLDASDSELRSLRGELDLLAQTLDRHMALVDRMNGAVGREPADVVPFSRLE